MGGRVGTGERAAGAGGARRACRTGRARPGHTGVGQPSARALRRADQSRRAVPAVPGGRLPHQPRHHVRPAPDAGRRPAEPVVHGVPDAAVPAADRRRCQHRLRDRPLPGDARLPAVPRPLLPAARRPGPGHTGQSGRPGESGRPAGDGGRRPARLGRRGAVHRLFRLHPAPAGPGRAGPLPGLHLPGAARQHGHPRYHRQPVRDQRPGAGRAEPGRRRTAGNGTDDHVRRRRYGHHPAR